MYLAKRHSAPTSNPVYISRITWYDLIIIIHYVNLYASRIWSPDARSAQEAFARREWYGISFGAGVTLVNPAPVLHLRDMTTASVAELTELSDCTNSRLNDLWTVRGKRYNFRPVQKRICSTQTYAADFEMRN